MKVSIQAPGDNSEYPFADETIDVATTGLTQNEIALLERGGLEGRFSVRTTNTYPRYTLVIEPLSEN
jgi:hypothetical protein